MKTTPTFAAELVAYDPSGPSTPTLTYASKGFTSRPSETPANATFAPVITQPIDIKRTMFAGRATRGRATTALGQLVLDNSDGALDDLAGYAFDGRAVTVRSSTVYQPAYPSDFTPIIIGTIKGQPELSVKDIRFTVRDRLADIAAVPLQTTRYAGSNVLPDGLEGVPEDLGGKPKPVCFGVVKNVPAPCVNTSKLIYQVNDDAVASIDAVRDRGVELIPSKTWVAAGSLGNIVTGVMFANGIFVAISLSGVLYTSSDGSTWTSRKTGLGNTFRGLAYGAGVWVCFTQIEALTSSDGVTWTTHTLPPATSGGYNALTFHEESALFVAGSTGGDIVTSPDGVTWTSRLTSSNVLWAAGYGAGVAVVAGQGGVILSSPDAITWTERVKNTVSSSDDILSIAYGNGRFVAAGSGLFAVSTDGIIWIRVPEPYVFESVVFADGVFIAPAVVDVVIASSIDGFTWTITTAPIPGSGEYAASDGSMVVISRRGTSDIWRSTTASYASTTDLLDDDLAPLAGSYIPYLAGGYFRLGGTPDGIVTADVTQGATAADRTVGQIANALLLRAGVSSGDIDSGDVSALDAADNAEIGFWSMADGMTCLTALDQVVGTCGAACFVGADGTFHLQQLLAPSGTPDLSLTADDIIGLTRVAPSDADKGIPTWRTRVRWGRNYQTITNDIAGAVTDSERARLAQEWRDVTAEDTAVQTAYPSSQEYVVESLYSTEADAQAEADRLLALRQVQRAMYDVPVELNDDTTAVDIGMVVQITYPRFGLDGGALFRVLDVAPDANNNRVTLTVWG